MKRFLFAISMVLVFGIPSASMGGSAKETGVVAHWSGTYTQHPNGEEPVEGVVCSGDVCSGNLVSCAADEGLAVTLTVFYFIEGICDDALANHPTACASRFTARAEECALPIRDIKFDGSFTDGPLISVMSRGVTRICFDEDTTGDCTDALATNEIVIGTGKTLTQTRLIPAGGRSPASATTETTMFSATSFFDSEDELDKKLRFKETVAQITLQRNPTGAECGTFTAGGCGVAGTSVRSGTTR